MRSVPGAAFAVQWRAWICPAGKLLQGGLPLAACLLAGTMGTAATPKGGGVLETEVLARQYFGADAPWFVQQIPFLEIDDAEIQEIYYYRWKLYRAHLREIGTQGTTVLEFLPDVPWAREPYTDLNDSASFHLSEGRWLRDAGVVDDLIDHEYSGGGNDRHFSESIAAATVGTTLVTGDPAPAMRHLDTMQHVYNLWDDHFDRTRNLYWIEPLLDATEYTIASIDASGAGFTQVAAKGDDHNGFTGGYAFRPSINSYQYANALAIAQLAAMAGQREVAVEYQQRASRLQEAVLTQLWNPALRHFTDRYQRSTQYVTAGDFIRGRELVGFTPWLYELPPKAASTTDYAVAWEHVQKADELAGPQGLRTVEPTYTRYLTQYRYDRATGLRECQWNGPSWPFQTSQVLTGLANLLNDYPATSMTQSDYLHLLRQYTHQHYAAGGRPDLQEDYDPDQGGSIVGLPRSHHYAHSTYVDLILSGLIGVRPRADEVLEIHPLLAAAGKERRIRYFALEGLLYHGHEIGLRYDMDGLRYQRGKGLTVTVDGREAKRAPGLERMLIPLAKRPGKGARRTERRVDLAVNPGRPEGPLGSASTTAPGSSIAEAIDGRMWFFPEIGNGWSPANESRSASWYAVDLRERKLIGSVELYLLGQEGGFAAPESVTVQYDDGSGWRDAKVRGGAVTPVANGMTRIALLPIVTEKLRVVMRRSDSQRNLRLIELKVFSPVGRARS